MKDVLIYGALVGAVLAAAVPMIGDFVNQSTQGISAINRQVNVESGNLLGAVTGAAATATANINSGSGTTGGDSGTTGGTD